VVINRPGDPVKPRLGERLKKGALVLLFIVITFAAWWLIMLLANVVIGCVPIAPGCHVTWPLTPEKASILGWVIIVIAVFAALLIAKLVVYPEEKYPEAIDPKETT
jgi:lysylphosphatidylglycerol synthetase-like protein (DUF2156 family)